MKLIATTISDTSVHMRYADSHDPMNATQWIDFQVPLAELMLPDDHVEVPLEDPETRYLGAIRLAALRYARKAIDVETRRLSGLLDRST
jgi:hypothetical protein